MGKTLTLMTEISFEIHECPECSIQYALPGRFEEERRKDHRSFYCPNGHSAHYPQKSPYEKEKALREQRERELAAEVQRRQKAERDMEELRKTQAKEKKRIAKSVCPCCNRTFADKALARHLKTKHPQWEEGNK